MRLAYFRNKSRITPTLTSNSSGSSSSNVAKDSALVRFVLENKRIARLELIPLHVHNKVVEYNPRVAEGEIQDRILTQLERLSLDLGTKSERSEGRLVVGLPVLTP